jgi:hypothetical protein
MTALNGPNDALLFIVGPIHVYVSPAKAEVILESFDEIRKYVVVAAAQLEVRHTKSKESDHGNLPPG